MPPREKCLAYFALFWLSFVTVVRSTAAGDSAMCQHFDIATGLPSNNIYQCIQDKCGYLWFATEGGVLKYNGYEFKVLNVANAGLPDDDVYNLAEDSIGRIWVYTLTRRFGYLKEDKFHDIKMPGGAATNILRPQPINAGRDGRIAFGINEGTDSYIATVDGAGHFTCLPLSQARRILTITETGNVYFVPVTFWHEIKTFDYFSGRLPLLKKGYFNNAVTTWHLKASTRFTGYKNHLADVRTDGKHVLVIDIKTHRFTDIDIQKLSGGDTSEYLIDGDWVNGSYEVISNKNIYFFNSEFTTVTRESLRQPFLQNAQLTYLFADWSGDKWYLSNTNGLWRKFAEKANLFSLVPLPDNDVRFTGSGGAYIYFWQNRRHVLYQFDSAMNMENFSIPSVSRLESTCRWGKDSVILSFADQLIMLQNKTGQLSEVYPADELVWIRSLQDGKATSAWPNDSIRKYGITKKDYYSGHFAIVKTSESGFIGAGVGKVCYCLDSAGKMYVSQLNSNRYPNAFLHQATGKCVCYSNESICVIDPVTLQQSFFSIQALGIKGLSKCSELACDPYGNCYILGSDRLFQYNIYTHRCRRLAEGFNLVNAHISVYKNIFVLSGRFGTAVAPINGTDGPCTFRCAFNLQHYFYNEVKKMAVFDNGRIFLHTDRGGITANADSILQKGILYTNSSNTGRFALVLNEPYTRPVYQADTISLEPPAGRLLVDVVNAYGSGKISYHYRIEGIHNEWQQSSSGELYMGDITPGKYYRLLVRMSDDVWCSDILQVHLYIRPYWYQTAAWHTVFWMAGGIMALLSILGIIAITRYAVTRAHARRQMLTDLELRAIHSQINPHFIFNTLSTALYFINRKEYENAYGHVNKFSHLLRSYLKSSHNRYVVLAEEIEMLKRYIELQQARFEDKFDYEITVENKVPAGYIEIPSLLLQPLVENAINHGLFHRKGGGGILRISFEQGSTSNELVCRIEDNGVGRERASLIKQQNDAARESFGTRLTEKLVSIFRQYEEVSISIAYADKQLPETGTIVTLTLGNIRFVT